MKAVLISMVLVLACIGSTAGCTAVQAPLPQRSEDEQAIRQVLAQMTDGFNRHDAGASVSGLADDADFVNVKGAWWRGRDEIEKARRAGFEGILRHARIDPIDTRVRFVSPDVAVAHVTFELSGLTAADGQSIPASQEIGTRVLVRRDGRWLVAAIHSTTISP